MLSLSNDVAITRQPWTAILLGGPSTLRAQGKKKYTYSSLELTCRVPQREHLTCLSLGLYINFFVRKFIKQTVKNIITWLNIMLWEKIMPKAVFKIRSETCQTEAQFRQNLPVYMIKKESLPDWPKFCRSGSVVWHLFWRLLRDVGITCNLRYYHENLNT